MALYFYFNETTGDLVYSDQATYAVEGYASLGEQTNMKPTSDGDWVFGSKKSGIKTVTKDPVVAGKIAGLTGMIKMFSGCSSLASLDLSGFDTSKVTSMSYMFSGCSSLASIDLSGFNTSLVEYTSSMFDGCSSLASIDLSGFDTSKAVSMAGMFSGCSSLTSLDLSNFDTSKVTSMLSMFDRCSSLTSLDLSGFDTSQVMSMNYMFNGCSGLTSLDLSGFDTSKATGQMISMFAGCSLDIVRCRPKQFLKPDFIIPSASGAWYDYKGAEVADFSSDAATSLYSDPSKAPDGSKLVNLQDLKAALEAMDGGLPFTEDTVISESGGEPAWIYAASTGDGSIDAPGFVGRVEQEGLWMQTLLACGLLQLGGNLPVGGSGNKNMLIGMELSPAGPVLRFWYDNAAAMLAYHDGMPVLSAMGETGPVMAGDHPYGFATYATDSDFEDYVFQGN